MGSFFRLSECCTKLVASHHHLVAVDANCFTRRVSWRRHCPLYLLLSLSLVICYKLETPSLAAMSQGSNRHSQTLSKSVAKKKARQTVWQANITSVESGLKSTLTRRRLRESDSSGQVQLPPPLNANRLYIVRNRSLITQVLRINLGNVRLFYAN